MSNCFFFDSDTPSACGGVVHFGIAVVLLIGVLQTVKAVTLELLADALPLPIPFESRRKKIQRFIDWEAFSIENCWFPWLKQLAVC